MADLRDADRSNDQHDGEKLRAAKRERLNWARISLLWICLAQTSVHNGYTHGLRHVAIYDNTYSVLFPYRYLPRKKQYDTGYHP
jgi:hypothetical protein